MVKAFADLKLSVESDGVGASAQDQLDTANRDFVVMLSDWQNFTTEEQTVRREEFVQAQTNYHYVAGRLLKAMQPESNEPMDDNDGADNSTEHSVQSEPTSNNPSNKVENNIKIDASVGAVDQFKPMCTSSYDDHRRVMDPVHSLQRIEYVDERILNEVIACIIETLERAKKLKVIMPIEVHRSMIAYIHGLLDITSQSMLAWRFALDGLVDFLRCRATRILPIDRAPSTVSRAPSSIGPSGPSGAKKSKKSCPKCFNDHTLIRCPVFKQMLKPERRLLVNQLNLCENCLYANHNVASCTQGACTKCNTKHNSLLPCPPEGAEGGSAI